MINCPSHNHHRQFYIPTNVPKDRWCDFRKDYETGMTLKELGEKYHCDARTVKTCLFHNKSSSQLGKRNLPRKLMAYTDDIRHLLNSNCIQADSLYSLSKQITAILKENGYDGSERTVRNYLSSLDVQRISQKPYTRKESTHDKNNYY